MSIYVKITRFEASAAGFDGLTFEDRKDTLIRNVAKKYHPMLREIPKLR